MPTIEPEGFRPSAPEPHRQRQVAESFGADAERYDRARPRYPDALVDRIVGGSPGPDVLDVGSGTGIAARQFRAAGCRVLGVEPDARMAEVARGTGIDVVESTFEAWDPVGRRFDTVVAAQAWHWVDPFAGAAKAAQALRPGGRLAVFWNAFEFPPEAADAFTEVFARVLPDAPMDLRWITRKSMEAYALMCAKAAEGIRAAGAFGGPAEWRHDWEWTYTRETWLDQLPTLGPFTQLPAEQLGELLEGMGAAVDALGGGFAMRYASVTVTAVTSPGA
ncbi:class I SAM-dependent methyltransferase [Streptomyces sp. NPDC050803]|uniref:class I SAM-dependent methyltransferase n=1 Tax=unclassified Streptomyces TaxID=2593676 RepID=UPI003418EC50